MENKAFDFIEPERKEFIIGVMNDMKSGKLSTPVQVMERLNDMPKGRDFSYSERQQIFAALIAAMDNEQRERLLEVLKIARGL